MREYTAHDILSSEEVEMVINFHHSSRRRGDRWRNRLNIFHLACSAGLRASEIAGLDIEDVHAQIQRPYIHVPGDVGKGEKSRYVPLTWSALALPDLVEHLRYRLNNMGAGPKDPYVCSLDGRSRGNRLHRNQVRNFFISACKSVALPSDKKLTTHTGRHTFASHALAAHFPIQAVRAALGHASLSTTTVYAHVIEDEAMDGLLFVRKKTAASANV
jgi:integrase/recombinase XerD